MVSSFSDQLVSQNKAVVSEGAIIIQLYGLVRSGACRLWHGGQIGPCPFTYIPSMQQRIRLA